MGKNRFIRLAAWAMGAWAAGQGVFAAPSGSTPAKSFTGTFANDSDQREFFFTLASGGPVTVRTFSYAGGTNAAGTVIPAGGFDPTVSLYDSSGVLLAVNQDGGCGVVAADPVTSSCWDSYLPITLPAGTYRVVLTQLTNLPAGPTLADSFIYNPNNLFGNSNLVNNVAVSPFGGGTNFTQPPGAAPGGFWDFFPSQRTSAYAIDIIGAATAIAPAVSTSSVLPFGVSGTGYAPVTLAVQSATGVNYTWTPPATGLPPGLSMNTAGVISGTPGSTGTFTFTVTATDGVQAVQQTETIIVYGPLSITTSSLPAGVRGQSYGPVQLVAAGGSGTQQWTASGLTGLTLSASGSLSGTTPASVPSFSVTATDPVTGQTATATYSITVTIPPLLVSGGGTLTEIAVGSTTSASFGASGGTPPYTFTSSSLPPGFSLSFDNRRFQRYGYHARELRVCGEYCRFGRAVGHSFSNACGAGFLDDHAALGIHDFRVFVQLYRCGRDGKLQFQRYRASGRPEPLHGRSTFGNAERRRSDLHIHRHTCGRARHGIRFRFTRGYFASDTRFTARRYADGWPGAGELHLERERRRRYRSLHLHAYGWHLADRAITVGQRSDHRYADSSGQLQFHGAGAGCDWRHRLRVVHHRDRAGAARPQDGQLAAERSCGQRLSAADHFGQRRTGPVYLLDFLRFAASGPEFLERADQRPADHAGHVSVHGYRDGFREFDGERFAFDSD